MFNHSRWTPTGHIFLFALNLCSTYLKYSVKMSNFLTLYSILYHDTVCLKCCFFELFVLNLTLQLRRLCCVFLASCKRTLIATTAKQVITSPGFPQLYPPNADCLWIINALGIDIIVVEFLYFRTQTNRDYLTVLIINNTQRLHTCYVLTIPISIVNNY